MAGEAEVPKGWDTRGAEEIPDPQAPKGWVRMEKIGDELRGVIRDIWRNRWGPVATVTLTEVPSAKVYYKAEGEEEGAPVEVAVGEAVWLNLGTVDLQRKITKHLLGEEVGIQWKGTQDVEGGVMKLYRVVVFEPGLPF